MKITGKNIIWMLLLLGAAAAFLPQTAMALGTAAGQSVTNNATASYAVNGVLQSQLTTSTSFVVDDKVNFTVTADDGGAISIQPNAQAALKFTVKNIGNNTHDFALVASQLTGTTIVSYVIADNTNGTLANLKTSGSGSVYIDELAPDASQIVYIVATANGTAPNSVQDNFSLAAIAHCASTGAGTCAGGANTLGALSQSSAGDKSASMNTVFTVLGDGHGDGTGDLNYDGQYIRNALVGFQIAAPVVSLAKASRVFRDPVCDTVPGCTTPRAIPQSTLTYSLTMSNAGQAAATAVQIQDTLPSFVTYAVYVNSTEGLNCTASQVVLDGVCAGTGGSITVSISGSPQVLSVSGLTVDPAGSHTIKYMVTVN